MRRPKTHIVKKDLLRALTDLHNWRLRFNGSAVGFGTDYHKPDEMFHYPEAYALFGNGYLKLYYDTGKGDYLDIASLCYERLVSSPSERYSNLSWGLPWGWEHWCAPPDLSYVCTTMFVGIFFVNYFKATRNKRVVDAIWSIYHWLVDENGYHESEVGVEFFYANHEPLKFSIYNHNALVLDFLIELWHLKGKESLRKLACEVQRFIISNQNDNGSWCYSDRSKVIDNFHSALVILGLAKVEGVINGVENEKSLKRGLNYYKQNFILGDGKVREVVNQLQSTIDHQHDLRKYARYIFHLIKPTHARLWSYGAAVKLLCQVGDTHGAAQVASYTFDRLRLPDGAFRFRENHAGRFIRHESHVFDGLATLLSRM